MSRFILVSAVIGVVLAGMVGVGLTYGQQPLGGGMGDQSSARAGGDSLSLMTANAEEGFALALTLSRRGVTATQPDKEVLHELRPEYANDPDALIAASQVVAIHFQTVAAANNYWRE